MKSLQMICNRSEGKLWLEQKLGTSENVKIFNEVLDNMIRDGEKIVKEKKFDGMRSKISDFLKSRFYNRKYHFISIIYLSDVGGSADRVREMRKYQKRNRWIRRSGWMGRMASKRMLGLKLRSSEDVELFNEVLDNMIRDEEEGEDQIESSSL